MSNRLQQELLKPRKWFDYSDSGDTAEFYIYDVIGSDMWGDGLRAIDFIRQVKDSKAKNIEIHINSPGGDFFDGIAIYQSLMQSGKNITTMVDGIAASSAATIFRAGQKRMMPVGAMVMIHNAWTFAMGNSAELSKVSENLAKADAQLVEIYSSDKCDKKKIKKMMDDTTYLDGSEAVENGIATEILDGQKIAACAWDLKILSGLPERFHKMQNAMNKRDIEAALRDAGWSNTEAKRLAAGPRDAENDEAGIIAILQRNIQTLKTA